MVKQATVAEFLTQAIEISGRTQKDIALDTGWEKPNILSMMKQGLTKVPLDKVPALAKACRVDPVNFLRIAMNEYSPDVWAVIREHVGEPLSPEEKKLIEDFRAGVVRVERVE